MADLMNLAAESGRNIIGDDSSPTLTLENTSSGEVLKLQNAGGTGVQVSMISCPTTSLDIASGDMAARFRGGASASHVLDIAHSVVGGPTIAPIKITNSAPSGVVFDLSIGLVSSASISEMAGAIPVRLAGEDKVVYIPLYEVS